MTKSDDQDQGCLRFKWNVPHMFFLFSDDLHQVCKRIYAVLFAISCKTVMSNLLISLSITHSSMIICNCPHSEHAQVNVGHTHETDMVM